MIPSQPVLVLSPECYVLSGEATHIMVFGLILMGLEHTIYHTRGEHANHYTIDAVGLLLKNKLSSFLSK
jgi:hypothetical protein